MSRALITEDYLKDIADAIRAKNGSSDTYTPPQMAAAILDIPTGGDVDIEPLSVTQNGTYTAPTGKAYSPVTVNVSGGGGEPLPMAVTASSTFSQSPKDPSGIFGDVAGNFWGSNGTNNWLNINFTMPFNLKKVRLSNYYRVSTSTYWYSSNITVRASNDGFVTYTDLYTGTELAQSDTQFEINLNNSNAYTEYRFIVSDTTAYAGLGRVSLL